MKNTTRIIAKSLQISGRAIPSLAICAYFSGWQYANEYFSSFDITRSSISFKDYTVFTHSFSVIANLWKLVIAGGSDLLWWLIPLAFFVSGPYLARKLDKRIPRLLMLRLWTWIWLIILLFHVSQQAGAYDASLVKKGCARMVIPYFKKSFNTEPANDVTKLYMNAILELLDRTSQNNAVALIWRSPNETLFLILDDRDPEKTEPLFVYRIQNSDIALIASKQTAGKGESCQ